VQDAPQFIPLHARHHNVRENEAHLVSEGLSKEFEGAVGVGCLEDVKPLSR
jgi:hypothetical protein